MHSIMPTILCLCNVWVLFSTLTNSFFNVISQQKQQQGNHLAKETDRLMKAFTALPVGPDQVMSF